MAGYQYRGPDWTALKLAQFLRSAVTEGKLESLPEDIAKSVDETIRYRDATVREDQRRRQAETAKVGQRQAVLDADTPLAGFEGCEERVYHGSRDFRGSKCSKPARFLRKWTTREFSHFTLDGKVLDERKDGEWLVEAGWEIGKGFTKRPITEEENARLERHFLEKVHEAKLCGTHRRLAGKYGYPY